MAVVKIVGTADNIEIVFERAGGDEWVATVPFDVDGTYVVEVRAYDDASNESYLPKMLYVVDKSKLIAKLVPLKYDDQLQCDLFVAKITDAYQCQCDVIKTRFYENVYVKKFKTEVVLI